MTIKRFLFAILFLIVPFLAHALEVPRLQSYVNDYAGLLSAGSAQKIGAELKSFEKSDSTQIVVLTIPSLEGENLEDFSIRVAEAWKIGQKGKDNGAIILVARKERKIRIEVGRGLEGKLTDLVSGRIIRYEIAPRFKAGDYDGGIEKGVSSVIAVVKGEYEGQPDVSGKNGKRIGSSVFTVLVFFGIACVFLGAISRPLGGLAGAIGLPLIASMVFPGLAILVLGGIALAGFFIGLFLTFLFGGGGGSGGGYFGGGPFYGGGYGGGSFGGGGGGFSGGGGDFGGGGASGDW
jgi:uncharacterized protein